MDNEYLTTGQVSRLCKVTIRTLQFYDKIGFLKPEYLDPDSKRRYYSSYDIFIINAICQLKEHKFSLKEIKEIVFNKLKKNIFPYEEIRKKKEEIQKNIIKLEQINNSLDYWLLVTELGEKNTYQHDENNSFILKEIPERKVIYLRKKIKDNFENRYLLIQELNTIIKTCKALCFGPFTIIYHDDKESYDPNNADVEMCMQVIPFSVKNINNIRIIPSGLYASTTYKGYRSMLKTILFKLIALMKENNYEKNGPVLFLDILGPLATNTSADCITEIQIPIKQKK